MKINKKYLLVIFIFAIATLASVAAYDGTGFMHNIPTSKYSSLSESDILANYNDTDCTVEASGICTKVVDGDTIEVEGVGKVRFVGVNTPEIGQNGSDTSKYFVEKFCLNKEVGLDIDDSKHEDNYGRTLAVVIVDGKNLNEMLLCEDLAEIMYIPPSEFNPYLWENGTTDYQHFATSATLNQNTGDDSGSYIGNSNSMKFHASDCRYGLKVSDSNKVTFDSREDAINQGYKPCKVCNP